MDEINYSGYNFLTDGFKCIIWTSIPFAMSDAVSYDLEYFFSLSPDLICIAGYDGFFKKINPAVSQTLGYTNEELLSRPITSFVHPDDQIITTKSRQSVKGDVPLINFQNRYITKSGEVVWLFWTSTPIKRDKVIFAIAKKINNQKTPGEVTSKLFVPEHGITNERLRTDQLWLHDFELAVQKYIGTIDLNIGLISNELAISERQLFRRVKRILGITPNKLIRNIRLKVAMEAITTGKYRTLAEISSLTGFETPAYFSRLFTEVYGINVLDVLLNVPVKKDPPSSGIEH